SNNKHLGKAPHKPVLLLSIISLIKKGFITNNRIYINSELLLSFKNNWNKVVETKHSCKFYLPFFHLRSEPFWYLVSKNGKTLELTRSSSIKSFKSLNANVAFAEIDKELFQILKDEKHSSYFIELLIDLYFPNQKSNFYLNNINDIETNIQNQILKEDGENYQLLITELKSKLPEDEYEEEIYLRGGLFKRIIPKLYNYSCCISEMRIESLSNIQMIDACHIIPFSISKNDTITNGLSLSPNLHRAFDRGLITINKNYIVRVSPIIIENDSPFSLSQFEGKQIILPENDKYYPSPISLDWHNKEYYRI
uniref:HNH endonuclease n=1 Tax=Polaribacter sp. TaxID=1920175 RepID=UPI003F6B9CBB